MATLRTSNGLLKFRQHLLYQGNHKINETVMVENLRLMSEYLDKIGIKWGPAFGTLIGIVRNDSILPWASFFNIYILKEDEERFKEILWELKECGIELMRYERCGLYYLQRNKEYFKVFVLHKISSDVRHTGGSDFIHEKYVQDTVKWNFKGVELNVPSDIDEYLTFQYGDWIIPQEPSTKNSLMKKYIHWATKWIQDHLPNRIYYSWLKAHRLKNFKKFRLLCEKKGCPLPINIQFSNLMPRKYKKILTVGVYDIIHKGHAELYRRAKILGDYLIVAVQDGDYILKYKPNAKVLNSTQDRMYMVKSIRYVDETICYTDVDEVVKQVDFDVFVTGPDQIHEGFQRAIKWCEAHGKEHIVLGRTEGISSSDLKAKIIQKQKELGNV